MLWKLNKKKYKSVYDALEQIKIKANHGNKVSIYVDYLDKFYNGTALSKSTILISKKVVKLYTEQPLPLKSLLAHEFAHIITGDLILQFRKDRKHDIHTSRLINIIKEIRAEIIGANLIGFLPCEINMAQNILREKNEGTRIIKEAYNNSYPTRTQIKYFAKRYTSLNQEIIDYFIGSYFKHLEITDITNQREIRKKVKDRFV